MALFKLAVRNLARNRRRTAITLVALVLGVAAQVGVRGFVNGVQRMMFENAIEGRFGAVQVHRKGFLENVLSSPLTLDFEDSPALRQTLLSTPHVVAAAPRIEFGAMLSTPDKKPAPEDGSLLPEADQGKTSYFMATAIDPTLEAKVTGRRFSWLRDGRVFPAADSPEVMLSQDFGKGLEVAVHEAGAPLPEVERQSALLAPDKDGTLNGENVVVGGQYVLAMPGDKRVGLVPLAVAQRLLRMEGRVTEYALALDDWKFAPQVSAALTSALGPDYEVSTWDQVFPVMKDLSGHQNFIFNLLSAIFLVVVLLGIVNSMLMSVMERTREIGTMLAVGMRRKQIVQLFVLEGTVLGALGGVLGLAVGIALTTWLNQRGVMLPAPGTGVDSLLRPTVGPLYLLTALGQTLVGAALASVWPASRASALRPVEALAST